MTIFAAEAPGRWLPSPLSAGPFTGLQGGAVAGLLTAEVESLGAFNNWGMAVSASAWFLRPTPLARLRTRVTVVRTGGRVAIIDNTLWPDDELDPCATVRVTLMRNSAVEVPASKVVQPDLIPPEFCAPTHRVAAHGGPWFMDAMEMRVGENIVWFRMKRLLVANAGPLSQVLGPADWAHGIARPVHNVVADPNPNLTVHLARPPIGEWLGLRSRVSWEPSRGMGVGGAILFDEQGAIGCVSMAVALKELRKTPQSRLETP